VRASLLLLAGSALCACSSETESAPGGDVWFVEQAAQRGLDFVHRSGAAGNYAMPEIMCGGAALVDVDGDGDLDAYLVQAHPAESNRLYANDGAGNFTDISAASGATDHGYGNGVSVGDYDADGDFDLYVTNLGPNVLLENLGSGTFRAVPGVADDPGWGASSAFVDYDRDGDLDLFVCNYLGWSASEELPCFNTMGGADYCNPRNYQAPVADVLYRNDAGRFVDVSQELGIAALPGTGLGVVIEDFNLDGWPDIFVANDGMPDRLWMNQAGASFVDQAREFGCALDQNGRAAAGMGVVAADVDADGDPDLLVCNLRNEPDSFFRNEGGRILANRTALVGLAATSRRFTRFGMGWHDFDHDGELDLYQANGRVMRQRDEFTSDPYAEPNLLYRGLDGRFVETQLRGGTQELLCATSRAAAFGDVDGDGAVDVLVVNRDGPAHLLLNRKRARGNWILFDLDGPGSVLGARLEVRSGGRTLHRVARVDGSYQAASDARVHVGLGAAQRVDEVKIVWPDGGETRHGPFAAGAVYKIARQGR